MKVEARLGYFAPKDFRQYTREDRELQLQQAMDLDQPFLDLPFAVDAAYFRRPDKKYYVVLAAKIPGPAVSFLRKSSTRQTQFDFVWRATGSTGKPAGVLRDTLPVRVSEETYDQVLVGNILYEGGLVLPPGKYQLKVLVRENQTGRMRRGEGGGSRALPGQAGEIDGGEGIVLCSNPFGEISCRPICSSGDRARSCGPARGLRAGSPGYRQGVAGPSTTGRGS